MRLDLEASLAPAPGTLLQTAAVASCGQTAHANPSACGREPGLGGTQHHPPLTVTCPAARKRPTKACPNGGLDGCYGELAPGHGDSCDAAGGVRNRCFRRPRPDSRAMSSVVLPGVGQAFAWAMVGALPSAGLGQLPGEDPTGARPCRVGRSGDVASAEGGHGHSHQHQRVAGQQDGGAQGGAVDQREALRRHDGRGGAAPRRRHLALCSRQRLGRSGGRRMTTAP
jgi:hypothetical protein